MENQEETKAIIRPRHHTDPRATVNLSGDWYAPEEVEQVERQDAQRRAEYERDMKELWVQTPEGKLCLELYAKFQEYKQYLEENLPARVRRDGAALDFEEHKLFEEALRMVSDYHQEREEKDRRNLEKAQLAARCEHTFLDGERCRAPRMKGKKLCRMHKGMEAAKALKMDLGPMEDPDSIQVGIMKLQRAVIDGTLDHRQVASLAYLIQLAAWNVTRTNMGNRELPADEEEQNEEEFYQ